MKQLAGILREPGVDQRVSVASGNSGLTWMMEPSELFRGVACCKSSFLVHQLSVFFVPVRYIVVKITCSCFEMVLRTIKNTIVYHGSGPYYEVIALRLAIFVLKKKNSITMG
jgi:hypothetical protein